MRFFEQWRGFIWEYNSFGDYLSSLLARFIGAIVGIVILFLLFCFFYYYGEGRWPDLISFWNMIKDFFS